MASYGRGTAKARWCSGLRLAVLTPLPRPAPVGWALVPAAVHEREVLEALRDGHGAQAVLTDKGCRGRAFTAM